MSVTPGRIFLYTKNGNGLLTRASLKDRFDYFMFMFSIKNPMAAQHKRLHTPQRNQLVVAFSI
jgi:hypothetical protein